MPAVRRALLLLIAITGGGCFTTRYVAQAAYGQLELLGYSRPVDEVIADRATPARTAALLEESRAILAFARRHALDPRGNYRRYVELGREAVVWFVAASRPLAFEPKVWRFPIAGSFPYLGWFEERQARRFVARLARGGWDVTIRPVRAYSTGGWFRDPIVSTMLLTDDDAVAELANVLLHELVHANVLVKDQAVFNESVASFIGDELTDAYLGERFGAASRELGRYRAELARERARGRRLARAYAELDAVYRTDAGAADKRAAKDRVTAALQDELELTHRPNNASLLAFKTYNSGHDALVALFATCGRSWPRFLAAVRAAGGAAFREPHQEALDAVIQGLGATCRAGHARGAVSSSGSSAARHSGRVHQSHATP
jgi:predicted aminopeptidase